MSGHSQPAIAELRSLAESGGGRMLAVTGSAGPFYAGLGRSPASTLLEAVLTFAAHPSYRRILIFSDAGPHLPEIDLGGNMIVGQTPGLWLFRDDSGSNGNSVTKPSPAAARPGEIAIEDLLTAFGNAGNAKVVHTVDNMTWAEKMEILIANVEERCGWRWDGARRTAVPQFDAERTLVIVDEAWIYPGNGRVAEARVPEPVRRGRIENRFGTFSKMMAKSRLDLLLLTTKARAEALQTGRLLESQDLPWHEMPSLVWDCLSVLEMPRVDPRKIWGHWLPGADSGPLYRALRCIPVSLSQGVSEDDPWSGPRMQKILEKAPERLTGRVKGQPAAVEAICGVITTAVAGMSGSGRPRGVLFFAGPTGVGKTELAKATAELVFGNERAYKQFDMGEFTKDHTVSRLFGPPPEYQGADRGGQLTGFVKKNPFSLVLFDEIEKAHPDLYKTLLAVLNDGQMTEASTGDLVSFSDCILIFTSNLGAKYVRASQPYAQVRDTIREAVRQHFYVEVGMPEFLGRLGFPGNVVVFDFIRPDVAVEIFEMLVGQKLAETGRRLGSTLSLAEDARQAMLHECTGNLDLGGRGIREQLTETLTNPLAKAIVRADRSGGEWRIVRWRREAHGYALDLEPVPHR